MPSIVILPSLFILSNILVNTIRTPSRYTPTVDEMFTYAHFDNGHKKYSGNRLPNKSPLTSLAVLMMAAIPWSNSTLVFNA